MAAIVARIPDSAITIRTYAELEQYADSFAGRRFDLVAVFSPGGQGKTQLFRRAMGCQEYLYVDGHATPFALYRQLHEYQNLPVLLDDADSLFRSPICASLLKPLCDTVRIKTLRWNSRAARDEKLPREFTTTSRVLILGNRWNDHDSNMRAVADRGLFLYFAPDALEVHEKVKSLGFVTDPEILSFMEQQLSRIALPSMRFYVKAVQLKRAQITNWRDQLVEMLNPSQESRDLALVKQLLELPFSTEEERVNQFRAVTGKSQATYYRYRSQLEDGGRRTVRN